MKKVTICSAIPIYLAAAVWLLAGIIRPSSMLKLWSLILVALLSAAAYFAGSKVFKGRTVEVREKVDTGNEEVNQQIELGRQALERLRQYNEKLPDPQISKALDRMTTSGGEIFDLLEKDVSKASEVRKFMSYYLPTADKIMSNYVMLDKTSVKGENIRSAMTAVENSLDMIATAFEKQLDSLYKDKSFDIETDIAVLETMLKGEGTSTDDPFGLRAKQESGKAQAGQ